MRSIVFGDQVARESSRVVKFADPFLNPKLFGIRRFAESRHAAVGEFALCHQEIAVDQSQPQRGGKGLVVVDGEEGKEYDRLLKGSRLIFDSPGRFHTLAIRGGECFRVEVEIVTPAAGTAVPH